MLSYQHGYHAGNASDVLKHLVLYLVLQSLLKKDTPFHYYDSHAGAGLYNLRSLESLKTGESKTGIEQVEALALKDPGAVPDVLHSWLGELQKIRSKLSVSDQYPGSPHWVRHFMREQDRATLLELHPAEYKKLSSWNRKSKAIKILQQDSFEHLPDYLPPKERRGIVLIDPSYEVKTDYSTVGRLVQDCRKRFANGVYLIWYPVVEKGEDRQLLSIIEQQKIPESLQVELVLRPERKGLGISATGMLILNSPWKLDEQVASSVSWLKSCLAEEGAQEPVLRWIS